MKPFEYGDQEIGFKEIIVSVASIIIGFGILTLPRLLSEQTNASDGWISILVGAVVCAFFAWIVGKLVSRFPRQKFFQYTSSIVTKPGAYALSFIFLVYTLLFAAYETRGVALIAKHYLFDRTPVEFLGLVFLWVVIYAAAGSRTALLRTNLLFFPIVVMIIILVECMNLGFFQYRNLKPFFTTEWSGYLKGAKVSILSFFGYESMLFYGYLVDKPKKVIKGTLIGLSLPILMYLVAYTFVIGVFGHEVTTTILYPTIELAKEVQVPGEFFERFESIFFTIWIMTIFNTTAMAMDIAVMLLTQAFPKWKKMTCIYVVAPVIYFISMLPQNLMTFFKFGDYLSYVGVLSTMVIPSLIYLVAKIRGIKGDE